MVSFNEAAALLIERKAAQLEACWQSIHKYCDVVIVSKYCKDGKMYFDIILLYPTQFSPLSSLSNLELRISIRVALAEGGWKGTSHAMPMLVSLFNATCMYGQHRGQFY